MRLTPPAVLRFPVFVACALCAGTLAAAEGSSLRGLRAPAVIEFTGNDTRTMPTGLAMPGTDLRLPPGTSFGLRERTEIGLSRYAYSPTHTLSGIVETGPVVRDAYTVSSAVSGQLVRAFDRGLGLGLGLRQQQAGPSLMALGIRQELGGLRGGYTVYSGLGDVLAAPSHRFALAYDYGRGSSIGLTYTEGREGRPLALSALPVTGTRDWTLSGMHALAPQWALTYDLVNSEHATFRRQGLHFGLRHTF